MTDADKTDYCSFVLRFWLEPERGWLAELEHLQSGAKEPLKAAPDIVTFLKKHDAPLEALSAE